MFLRTSTRSVLEKSLGMTVAELARMDYDQEMTFVKSKSGKKPVFSKTVDHRIAARGNHTITTKKIMTMEDVDRRIEVSLGSDPMKYLLTIRRFPEHPITMEKLISLGSITKGCADFLKKLVQARYSMVIGGGTGSGKTTFLAALSEYIPSDERLITVEDNAELRIQGIDNLVRLEAKMANTQGAASVTIRDLIKTALRMRPDRIIVGEVRGGEAMDMLQALNTGHLRYPSLLHNYVY